MEGVPQPLRAEAADPEQDQHFEQDQDLEQNQVCSLDTEDAAAAPAGKAEFCRFDYHVLFHPSYRVPALYFNGYNAGETDSLRRSESQLQQITAKCFWPATSCSSDLQQDSKVSDCKQGDRDASTVL